ncbi:hypothetical protein N7524_008792 [Penicillium chrysogenum]|nr:hypothetical protein N7524_008792 [Penicillium chrysogenum]
MAPPLEHTPVDNYGSLSLREGKKERKEIGSFSLIMRVILSAPGATLIFFAYYFQLTICPKGRNVWP